VKRLAVDLERRDKAENDTASAERQRLLAIEQPGWDGALAEARRKIAAYDFRGAVMTLNNIRVSEASLQEARAAEMKKAEWLVAWKTRLIADLKTGALQGEITVGRRATMGPRTRRNRDHVPHRAIRRRTIEVAAHPAEDAARDVERLHPPRRF
jgi:hypothetical protein